MLSSLLLLATAHLASAHFGVTYPAWRADTLTDEETYSQWDYPCAGVPVGTGNRTDWPLTGGSVVLDLHHKWTYVFINLGLGNNVTNFNISLTPSFLNVTGNGTYCAPTLPVPIAVTEGQNATLQVVTSGASGSALYNCADITFRGSAKSLPADQCKNTTQSATVVGQSSSSSTSNTSSSTSSTATPKSFAPSTTVNLASLTGLFGLAVVFAIGHSL